ncbi:hypothetical protein K491DRAFT_761160 [Lophiostoma macrostomum CBS 122681]|uniref:Uncharacterized protein n=1 Tax=Lophiostoma macrostomum CBS 122681 TaxID=1314788 RepID=A0A6A6SUR1_9PLEO|nr:hypothetical protein K491DRAFT_761160 [Lophiostoma macrostomum CBS 122681]
MNPSASSAPIAGPSTSKKKRNRARDRQRRKEKREQKRMGIHEQLPEKDSPEKTVNEPLDTDSSFDSADYLDSDEDEVDPTSVFGPRGEKKWEWDARVSAQDPVDASWSAFRKRAKARKREPIGYNKENYPMDVVVHVGKDMPFNPKNPIPAGKTAREIQFYEDQTFLPKLSYLEFRWVALPQENTRFLDFLTKVRPQLEIVWVTALEDSFIRDAESVELAEKLMSQSEYEDTDQEALDDDEDEAWEDSDDDGNRVPSRFFDPRISDDPKENARTFRKLRQQQAMREMLGRDLYDFEEDSDYGDYDLYMDSGDEIQPDSMVKLLAALDSFGDSMEFDD